MAISPCDATSWLNGTSLVGELANEVFGVEFALDRTIGCSAGILENMEKFGKGFAENCKNFMGNDPMLQTSIPFKKAEMIFNCCWF